jgi:bifunctional non-homologous end joining protein LigD
MARPLTRGRAPLPRLRDAPSSGPREALPADLPPMLATPGSLPTEPGPWRFEQKWDGYRALARWDGSRCILLSRSGLDLTGRFPELAGMLARRREPLLLDGEIVALDRHRRSSFAALQERMRPPEARRLGPPWSAGRFHVRYQLFDLLHCGGRSTRDLGYRRRRALLEALALDGAHWGTPPSHGDGEALLARMRRRGAEGVIAKRADSPYRPGERSADWIKVKLQRSDDFVVCGWWSSGDPARASSLLLGCHASAAAAHAGRPLRYCGKVGTGFSAADRATLAAALARDEVPDPPCAGALPRGQGVHWCRPRLVAQIRFTERTRDGLLRHPAFLGLREDRDPDLVVHPPQEVA